MAAAGIGSIATQAEAVQVRAEREALFATKTDLLTIHAQMGNAVSTLDSHHLRLSHVQIEAGNLGHQLLDLKSDLHDHMVSIAVKEVQLKQQLESVDLAIKKFDVTGSFRHFVSLGRRLFGRPVKEKAKTYVDAAKQDLVHEQQFHAGFLPKVEQASVEVEKALKDLLEATEKEAAAKQTHYLQVIVPEIQKRFGQSTCGSESMAINRDRMAARQEVDAAKKAVFDLKESLNRFQPVSSS